MSEETKIIRLNSKREPLTIEKLRTFKGLENLIDEEAQNTLIAIQKFTNILYEFMNEQKGKEKQHKEIGNDQYNKAA